MISSCFTMEKKIWKTIEKIEEKVGGASTVTREGWLINFSSLSPLFFNSGRGRHVSLFSWVKVLSSHLRKIR